VGSPSLVPYNSSRILKKFFTANMNNTDFKATENPTFSRPKIDISKDFRRSNSQIWQKKQQRNKILCQCFSTFLLQRNPTQA